MLPHEPQMEALIEIHFIFELGTVESLKNDKWTFWNSPIMYPYKCLQIWFELLIIMVELESTYDIKFVCLQEIISTTPKDHGS